MSIYKVNAGLSITQKIELLNNMLLELDGKIEKANFSKNELDQIFDDFPSPSIDRQFLRNQSLGHTIPTYTGWTHIQAETGYSIWKYTPTNYTYNILNQIYLDDKLLINNRTANSESATTFDYVYLYNGDSGSGYTNNTTEAGTEEGTEFELMDSTEDYLYVGLSTTFSGIKFEFQTAGLNYTLKVEYYDSGWIELTANNDSLDDNTSSFESNGRITWNIPVGWETTSVNSQTKYWIRISTTTTPTEVVDAYYIIPGNSVISLLALSSDEILNEKWVFCSYGSSIYITLRNAGVSAYEGNVFITSSSSATNKQNFFVYNHEITGNYQNSTY